MRIEIDELVIESPNGDRDELVRALRARLESLYAGGMPTAGGGQQGGQVEVADRSIETAVGATPGEIGQQVAQTIWNAARGAGRREETK